jgi:NADPH:quinone reductase-like Zn-dependent oxidoreductase
MMKAAVVHESGPPEVLKVETRSVPEPLDGQVLIRVKAFGVNRSEMFTRQGLSPDVRFPRILGIEAVGTVEAAPGSDFSRGQIVATAMGGMGRKFDGGYAEYTIVPATQVHRLDTMLPWELLGALPEMLQTAWGSLYTALRLEEGKSLLIRGGTTSIGLAAAAIASKRGVNVYSTSRNPAREALLRSSGAGEVFIDSGAIAENVRRRTGGGVDKVLELIGTTTLADSLRCVKQGGAVCMAGMVGNQWSFEHFAPMELIPSGVYLTIYDGGAADFMAMPFQELAKDIADGHLEVHIGKVFELDEIVEAHRLMESNNAGGKIVVLVP